MLSLVLCLASALDLNAHSLELGHHGRDTFSAASFLEGRTMRHVEGADVTIMVEAAYPPFNNYEAAHGLVGFDLELIPAVCKEAGLACAVIAAPWPSAWPGTPPFFGEGFLDHQFDCVAAAGNTVPRRQSALKFSDPYTEEMVGAFVAKKGVTLSNDLGTEKLGVVKGFSCGTLFLANAYPNATATEFETSATLFDALKADEVEVALTCPKAAAAEFVGDAHEIVKEVRGFNTGLAFMCHTAKAGTVAQLNKGLAAVRKSGELKTLCGKYPDIECEYTRTSGESDGGVSAVSLVNAAQKQRTWMRHSGHEGDAELTIMVEAAYPPFNNYEAAHGLVGFDLELIPAACKAGGLACAVIAAPWPSAWPGTPPFFGEGFLDHHFDCAAAAGSTLPRRTTMIFSDPYTEEVKGAFVGKTGTELSADLDGVKVGVVTGFSCGKTYLEATFPAAAVTEFETNDKLFAGLEAEEVTVALTCPLAVVPEVEGHGILREVQGFNSGLGFMCHPRSRALVARVNAGLAAVKQSGELKTLCEKYPDVKCELGDRVFAPEEGGVEAAVEPSFAAAVGLAALFF